MGERPLRARRVGLREPVRELSQRRETALQMLDLTTFRRWAPLPLRLIVGYGFIAHGFAKLSRGPDTFAVVLHTLGVPLPHLLAWATTLVELVAERRLRKA